MSNFDPSMGGVPQLRKIISPVKYGEEIEFIGISGSAYDLFADDFAVLDRGYIGSSGSCYMPGYVVTAEADRGAVSIADIRCEYCCVKNHNDVPFCIGCGAPL